MLLQGGELWSGEDLEGYHAGDEGLEERGAEEGAIAKICELMYGGYVYRTNLNKWYVAGFLNEYEAMFDVGSSGAADGTMWASKCAFDE